MQTISLFTEAHANAIMTLGLVIWGQGMVRSARRDRFWKCILWTLGFAFQLAAFLEHNGLVRL